MSQTCPKCGASKLKKWPKLSEEEKMLADRFPASAKYTAAERKKHVFCTRCWFEMVEPSSGRA